MILGKSPPPFPSASGGAIEGRDLKAFYWNVPDADIADAGRSDILHHGD
jgi:hypothetical protein